MLSYQEVQSKTIESVAQTGNAAMRQYSMKIIIWLIPAAWAYTDPDKIQDDLLIQSACRDNITQIICLTAELESRLK